MNTLETIFLHSAIGR